MRKKYVRLFFTAGALAVSLAACGKGQGEKAEYIGADAAEEIALSSAGFSANDSVSSSTSLEERDGIEYYQIRFEAGGRSYSYAVDALTGVIIEKGEGALAEAEVGEMKADPASADVTQAAGETAGEASEGTAGAPESTGSAETPGLSASASVDEEMAKATALAHAGVSEEEAVGLRSRLDREKGQLVYEISFWSPQGVEYEYEISASGGEVVSYSQDAEKSLPRSQAGENAEGRALIGEEKMKEEVLARVPGASGDDIFYQLEEDDGRLIYEGELFYDNMEYEFHMDAYSGSMIEWEADPMRQ